jgi:predicted AAA+ superfamily ATPase
MSSPAYIIPWRQIAEPRPDVADGRYRQSEFAADLSQVVSGNAIPEYQDPVEFYSRTFITQGIRGMLIKSVQRVSGKGGEPIIQLKTAFGGGKTHSMLALYHLMRTESPNSLNEIPNILKDAGITEMPKVKVAVLVGTALDPSKPHKHDYLKDITVNTLWGEMVAQLAQQSGNLKLYDQVKEADNKGISPGSETLKNIFDSCGPCMILIDELVAYARKFYGHKEEKIPIGTFDNILSFVQELTEAVRKSRNSIVVASVPESETEAGDEAGQLALARIEKTFGRMEAVWKPVIAEEGFEIVRRRLFKPITDQTSVEKTCNAYFNVYKNNSGIFPVECREADYLAKMKKCYPIHPEIFDRLYDDWATIERFQRTRGVLRLMAAVIHDLYSNNDSSAMIMPGSIAISKPNIRDELTRYLPEGWNPIIENEKKKKSALSVKLDAQSGGYYSKYFAFSHVARTIFLGSAPDAIGIRSQERSNRGVTANQIRLGVVQPEENPPVYNDALSSLADKLTYLYRSADNRYWFDTRPTLKKTVSDRAGLQTPDEIIYNLENELKQVCPNNKAAFEYVHVAPSNSGDIPDNTSVRLVLLNPTQVYKNDKDCPALIAAKDYYENRSASSRICRNMIIFLAPDHAVVDQLKQDMCMLMAWRSIEKDTANLNLDNAQQREVKDSIKHVETAVQDRLQEAYSWLIIPVQDSTNPITWSVSRISGSQNPVLKAAQKMKDDESLIDAISPKILSMDMSRFNLWKDKNHIQVRELWENYTKYVYLHRLKNQSVLFKTLEAGIKSGEYFGYADGQNAEGRYETLIFGPSSNLYITLDGLIVKPDSAKNQIESEKPSDGAYSLPPKPGTGDSLFGDEQPETPVPQPDTKSKYNHFFGTVKLPDLTKIAKTTGDINLEILQHFAKLPKATINVKLDIEVNIPDGVSDDFKRTIIENCQTLKFETNEFGKIYS